MPASPAQMLELADKLAQAADGEEVMSMLREAGYELTATEEMAEEPLTMDMEEGAEEAEEAEDESDEDEEVTVKKIDKNTLILTPSAEIGDIEKALDVEIPEFENVTSVSKAILEIIKRFAKKNERVQIDEVEFEILEVNSKTKAIEKIKATKVK